MKTGSCHCGAVTFTAEGEIGKAIECNCSHCSRKGFLLWFVPQASFAITSGQDKLTTYTFNRHAIQHQFCSVCGTQAFGLGAMPDGSRIAAINLRCVDGVEVDGLERVQVDGRKF